MKTKMGLLRRVVGIAAVGALLASCYASLANQKGYLNLSTAGFGGVATPTTAIVMVVDSAYASSMEELLSLIDQGYHTGNLSGSQQDRITTLAKEITTNGTVSFGGYPFYQATLTSSSGSFDIPGVPAGSSYFVKFFVLNQGVSFSISNIDQNFYNLVQSQNLAFSPENYLTPWQSWTPAAGQPVSVTAGQSVPLIVTLSSTVP